VNGLVIEFLRHLERLAGRPAEARAAEFLQRRQIMKLGWPLPFILDADSKRTLEVTSRIGNGLGNLAPNNPVLRRVPHLELASRNLRGRHNFEICERHEVANFANGRTSSDQRDLVMARTFDAPIG
jgi:hypothetical protein